MWIPGNLVDKGKKSHGIADGCAICDDITPTIDNTPKKGTVVFPKLRMGYSCRGESIPLIKIGPFILENKTPLLMEKIGSHV